MNLYLTKNLTDKLKTDLSHKPPAEIDALYSWMANYVQWNGQRFVVFMAVWFALDDLSDDIEVSVLANNYLHSAAKDDERNYRRPNP